MEITPEQREKLIFEAKNALKNVYPQDSKPPYIYGAAVLTKSGNIYSGTNYGSATASLTLHAEQAALSHAAAHGDTEIIAIAVASLEDLKKGEFTYPCHMCKQLLYENSQQTGIDILILSTNNLDQTDEFKISEVMSHPWPLKK